MKLYELIIAIAVLLTCNSVWAAEVNDIQIIREDSKEINMIIPQRNMTSMQYTVDFDGFYVECVSISLHTNDGRLLSHMYNRCTEHLK